MTFRRSTALMFLATGLAITSRAAAGTTISGTIKTTAGKAVVAAITIHDLSTMRTAGQTPYDHQFASKADGTFTLSGVPAGKYEFCVDAPQAGKL